MLAELADHRVGDRGLTVGFRAWRTPGFVGAMEFGIKSGLMLFGVDENQALAFALVYHITQYLPVTIGGFVVLWLEGFSMREISHVQTPDVAPDPA